VSENNPPQVPPAIRDWTFMVYMSASDSHKLDTVAVRDLKEMEDGAKGNKNVAVVAQINRHWPETAQRYVMTSKGAKLLSPLEGDTNMGKGETLSTFLSDVLANEEYRAKNYCLVLWGHAFGVGFGRHKGDALLLPELRGALNTFKEKRSGTSLELLGTNACSMSYLEAAFELKDVASLMVASQITVPFAGWPYNVILNRIGPDTKARTLAEIIVNAYVTQFDDLPGGDRLAMTVLDLQHAEKCGRRLEKLATAIHDEISKGYNTDTMAELRDIFMGAAAGDVRPLIDLTTLCEILCGKGTVTMADPIRETAADLLAGLRKFEPTSLEDEQLPKRAPEDPLIAYKRAHPALVDLKGIGVYAPFITDQGILDRLQLSQRPKDDLGSVRRGWEDYEELTLFNQRQKTRGTWPTLVYDDLKRTIPEELMVEIDGIGALQTGDRADVAQIIMSIEAVLNALDRAIKNGKLAIMDAVVNPKEPKLDSTQPLGGIGGASQVATLATPKTTFGPPWLRLIPALSSETLREVEELRKRQPIKVPQAYWLGPNGERFDVVDTAVGRLRTIERALSAAEQIIRRALTHVRFGLGPYSPNKLLIGETKSGTGLEPAKPNLGDRETKSGTGDRETKSGTGDVGALLRPVVSNGDLRADLALLRVADLFKQVGESLIALEAAAAGVETMARATLVVSPVPTPDPRDANRATAQEIDQAFQVLEVASSDTRLTLRRVLAHPVYGLGPGEEPLSMDIREELALSGGLSRRNLKLL
jgi:hypothetical protein